MECDELVGLTDQLARCPKLSEAARAQIATVRTKLDELLGAGDLDGASQTVRDTLRKTCRSQRDAVAEAYAQFAPNCVK